MKCLLIIDAQEAWRDKNSPFYIGDLKEFIVATNKLLVWARQQKIPIVFSLHIFKADGSDVLKQEKGQIDDFLVGNPRAELFADLEKSPEDLILIKNRFSVFSNPRLDKILKEREIKELIIGGITTNCCVRATIIDAYNKEYGITIVKEACASESIKTDEFTFSDLESILSGIRIKKLEEVLK